ncbi:laccase [Ferrigenium kumadai]|uniref:Laccase n=1 Tax=Ferrigenium kumadai TaxID=1682490 RepID=A0AAN1W0J7_9PROT|nr:multicopper oxidase domain-containing protein [Ferrigenium kumadai]BBI99711.1 laccase [Ferrigenium kumadai]
MKKSKFKLNRVAAAVMLAMAAPWPINMAYAGAGWGNSVDGAGAPIKVPTYYANSPSGTRPDVSPLAVAAGTVNTGVLLRKFVDGLPGLTAAAANARGQYLPVAVADKTAYPGSDYYEIGIVEYSEKMHSDLPKATTLRGYVQLETPANAATSKHIPLTYPNGTPILNAANQPVFAVDNPHYLGPVISANRGVPVRIKYSNLLPIGQYDPITKSRGGDLFLPVDKTVTGAGSGPVAANNYTQNRAEIHLHGGDSPWISDGTPHQWITPAGEVTPYPKGASFQNVPDMPDPGPGSGTLYYPNNQSARLMFYHDHTFGLTRVNVYAGEAAGYMISDPVEQGLVTKGILPVDQIPLIIQDKTFVPMDIAQQDAYWDTAAWGQPGDLWFPHVYEPNQSQTALGGLNPPGRWDYGPWFWPAFPAPLALPTGKYGSASTTPEAFMDTPIVNGTAYPTVTVQPKAYRLRVLNAANDRFVNLGLYVAADKNTITTPAPVLCNGVMPTLSANCTEVKTIPAATTLPLCSTVMPAPAKDPATDLPVGAGATCWPDLWPTDARAGGVPDPLTAGPKMVQIGSEGGFLPKPQVIPPTLIGFKPLKAGISTHGLYMGPAERADVVVDFSQFAGKTLILYNDSPAPVPGNDPRYDYYTGDPDQSGIGGAFSTLPGYGPNTRTIMQIVVAKAAPAAPFDASPAGPLATELLKAYTASQPSPIAAETAYNGTAAPVVLADTYAGIEIGSSVTPTFNFTTGDTLTYKPYDPVTKTVLPTLKTVAAGTAVTDFPVQNKAIMEQFDSNYGRLNATLGAGLPFASSLTRTALALGYIDPATETIADGETQIWKITHNGVDTHPVHFHLVNVQVINRVGWDGVVKPPEPNELGWKETVKMNPLEDVIVAVRAKAPATPFGIADSFRAQDPTQAQGVTAGFTQVDPFTGALKTVSNTTANFGWEYVWHCHILGHEENDFMRPIVFKYTAMLPAAPATLAGVTAAAPASGVTLTWTDPTPAATATTPGNAQNEIGFTIQRATGAGAFATIGTTLANSTSYTDTTAVAGTTYSYNVVAFNAAGNSPASNTTTVTPVVLPVAPAPTPAPTPARHRHQHQHQHQHQHRCRRLR